MSIEPKTEVPADTAVENRTADRPTSTAEVAEDLERPETRRREDDEAAVTLFPDKETNDFRKRWTDIQTGFVDEPRRAVEQADALVAEVIKRLADSFAAERSKLEGQWGPAATMSRPKTSGLGCVAIAHSSIVC